DVRPSGASGDRHHVQRRCRDARGARRLSRRSRVVLGVAAARHTKASDGKASDDEDNANAVTNGCHLPIPNFQLPKSRCFESWGWAKGRQRQRFRPSASNTASVTMLDAARGGRPPFTAPPVWYVKEFLA